MAKTAEVEARFEGEDVPRPEHWYGWRVKPDYIEFWQDGAFRLHDRIVFRAGAAGWSKTRLYP
jgi:pyridoxamine 5'-phosphate oxidase